MKKVLLLISLALIVLIGYWIYLYEFKTYTFAGNVDSLEGNTLIATGHIGQEEVTTTLEIHLSTTTPITRWVLHIPPQASSFDPEDLEQTEGPADLETIKSDVGGGHVIGIEAKLRRSGWKPYYRAVSLYFRVPLFERQ